jgi:uncharacterized protein involved in tolerance to divalent cations
MKELTKAVHSVYNKITIVKAEESLFRVNVSREHSKAVRHKIEQLKNYAIIEIKKPEVIPIQKYKIYRIFIVRKQPMIKKVDKTLLSATANKKTQL